MRIIPTLVYLLYTQLVSFVRFVGIPRRRLFQIPCYLSAVYAELFAALFSFSEMYNCHAAYALYNYFIIMTNGMRAVASQYNCTPSAAMARKFAVRRSIAHNLRTQTAARDTISDICT